MYPEEMVKPMREDLTSIGFRELKNAEEVISTFDNNKAGTTLVVINSVCGCAAAETEVK